MIHGFCLTQTQITAAEYGLRLIEELPGVSVEPHYDKFRLFFSDHHIDFSQAVAIEYYLFAAYFGMLRPGIIAKKYGLDLTLYMDRFPGASIGEFQLGKPIPKTDGKRFVEYVQEHSPTYRAIENGYKSDNVEIRLTTLDRWSRLGESDVLKGKDHPHFLLPDWLAVASIAKEYRGEFIASCSPNNDAVSLADSCENLYDAFKSFDIWSMDDKTLSHIVGSENKWEVSDDARKFILDRASR